MITGRIIDVERALTLRPYTEDGILTFESVTRSAPGTTAAGSLKPLLRQPGQQDHRNSANSNAGIYPGNAYVRQISPSRAAEMGRLEVKQLKH
jgi:hypothetical protein